MQLFMDKRAEGWEPAGDIFNDNSRFYKPMRKGSETQSFRVFTEIEKKAIEKADKIVYDEMNKTAFLTYQDEETNQAIDEWCRNNGFNSKRITYCILGNTYSIKDKLKDAGCRYHEKLGWHCYEPLSLPSAYLIEPVTFDDAFVWDKDKAKALPRESVKRLEAHGTPIEWAGDIGDTLENLEVTLVRINSFQSKYGISYIYTFCTDKNVLVWTTKTLLDIEEGRNLILLKAKIKNLETYKDLKQTVIKNASFSLAIPMKV